MRLTPGVTALAILACTSQLVAADLAYVLSYDTLGRRQDTNTAAGSLSPSIARVVLAQRIGAEDFHISGSPSDEEIDAINTYGTKTQLFRSQDPALRAIILAPLDDTARIEHELHSKSVFTINDAPSYSTTKDLFQDLLQQTDSLRPADDVAPVVQAYSNADKALTAAQKLSDLKYTVTVVLAGQGQDGSSWGAYHMPGQSVVHKRQSSHRLQDEEEPLSAFASMLSLPSLHNAASNSSKSSNSSNNKPLHGILPACFSSKSSCESTTRGCTGHGACSRKYTNADKKKNPECWACTCNATKSNGLTTYWSGPACQKKDISVEFWLITLFTVGLISLVGFAVGTIWSMGEEDLPSVIGAGVSGPTARK